MILSCFNHKRFTQPTERWIKSFSFIKSYPFRIGLQGGVTLNGLERRVLKDRRILKDRRKQPAPALSQLMLWWQRRSFRREVDRDKSGFVDLYSAGLLFLIIMIVGLDILDSLLTMMAQDLGGWGINPIVRSVVEIYRDKFWVSKFAIVSIPLILLCIHSKFRLAMPVILSICIIKVFVLLHQVF
jgi:hypothetical protein